MRVNQNGVAANYPATDPTGGWESEEALDIEMASAICPLCEIVLVEANSNSSTDLFAAEDTAATVCAATVISNSWDGPEYNTETSDEVHFNHGIPITVASGDSGFANAGDGYPVSSAYVTAVGGTTLPCPTCVETVWSSILLMEGSGSDCSQFIAQPAWQTALGSSYTSVCNMRIANDVSAVADPGTPVAGYDSYSSGGWTIFGGTSVATPIIASVYALAGTPGIQDGSYSYSHTGSFHDITSGSNDIGLGTVPCGGTFMCTGEVGYDAPSGNGTPNGIGGF